MSKPRCGPPDKFSAMLADAVVTASPIEAEVITERTDPLETISPAESRARIDRHSILGILLLGSGLGMRVRNTHAKRASFGHTLPKQIVPLTSRLVRDR